MPLKLKIIHAHASRYNIGDDAIAIATYQLLDQRLNSNYQIIDISLDEFVSNDERIISYLPLYKLLTFKHIIPYVKAVSQCDVVIIGGGELIAGGHEFIGLALLARLFRKPVYFFSLGVNMQAKSKADILLAKHALKYMTLFTVRDRQAKQELINYNVPPHKIMFCNDIVFSLTHETHHTKSTSNKKLIGISLRTQESNNYKFGCPELIRVAAVLDSLSEKLDVEYIFYPFLKSHIEQHEIKTVQPDTDVINNCIALMKKSAKTKIYTGEMNPAAIMESLSKLDLLIAMRLHANILGLMSGTKVIPISYAKKIDRVMREIDSNMPIISLKKEIDINSTVDLIHNHLLSEVNYSTKLNAIRSLAKNNIYALGLDKLTRKKPPVLSYVFAIPLLAIHHIIKIYYKI